MDKTEKVAYEASLIQYIEKNQLPDLIEQYTKQLILNQPEDPIQFLINYIQNKKNQRLIFITGSLQNKRYVIVEQVCNSLYYEQIKLKDDHLLKQTKSEIVNQQVKQQLQKVGSHFRGVIVNGYPFNFETSIFAQWNGLIPDRVIILENSEEDSRNYYSQKFQQDEKSIVQSMKRDEIFLQEIKRMYNSFYDTFNISNIPKSNIVENIKSILKLKDKRVQPLRSPRIFIVRPPHLKVRARQIQSLLVQKYGFNQIQVYDLLNKHIELKTHVGKFIYGALSNHRQVPDDIILGLVRTEILNTSSKQKGYILEGFPKSKNQVNCFSSYEINPHFIIILDYDDNELLNQFKQLKFDDKNNRFYENNDTFLEKIPYMLKQNDFDEDKWKEQIQSYRDIISSVEDKFDTKAQKYNLSVESNEKIIQSVDSFLNNSDIYS
ncbi:hypothetical protein IMG5_119030 [Ichthyophthirius multifiliis]|uniref:Adenylate kinase n=1 Tax=Ichthyophthirius multifiliis TaxID=5932 RepID=G0QUR7_ICHMU|nr:hypothetical protein IMG5_119030 [Ichthyophthirius multifiliis]EGR31030.1 hypothetical protein IMG5_119030 [Ichthyophthirius multifiliis]|eukprot:XP_004034516.1 hypothetical protein IMG5_119030 [Ichthyophthirius multifiliis]